jgi:hypothetical protein
MPNMTAEEDIGGDNNDRREQCIEVDRQAGELAELTRQYALHPDVAIGDNGAGYVMDDLPLRPDPTSEILSRRGAGLIVREEEHVAVNPIPATAEDDDIPIEDPSIGEIALEAFLPGRNTVDSVPDEDVTKYVERTKLIKPMIAALAVGGVLLLGIVIGLSVGLTRKVSQESQSQPTESPEPIFPSQTPTSSPAPSAFPTIFDTSLVFPLVADHVRTEFGITSYERIQEDYQSPQSKAARWIGEVDAWFTFPISQDDTEQRQHFRQRFALATFFYSTGGEESWIDHILFLSDVHECEWFNFFVFRRGLSCDSSNTRVMLLNIPENNLTGSLPEEIWGIEDLMVLGLSSNAITGPIPDELYSLSNLLTIQLPYNSLSGTISTLIGNLVNLISWSTEDSNLIGPLPSEIGQLTQLKSLLMSSSRLTGTLPAEYSLLSNITAFDVSSNQLTGTLPSWVSDSPFLTVLGLFENLFTGTIPNGMYPATSEMYFYSNMLTGTIPNLLVNRNLESFSVRNNNLTGRLPEDWSAASNLYLLDVSENLFTGTLPSSLGLLTSLALFLANDNQLTGPLVDLGNSTSLYGFSVSRNKLSGTIPESYSSLPFLSFYVQNNSLVGNLTEMCASALQPTILANCPPDVVW